MSSPYLQPLPGDAPVVPPVPGALASERPSVSVGHLLVWNIVAVAASAALAGAVGTLVGFAYLSTASDSDDWAALGAFVLGMVAGAGVFALAWVLALVLGARRFFPTRQRLGTFGAALGTSVLLGAVAVTGVLFPYLVLGTLAGPLALFAPALVWMAYSRVRWRKLLLRLMAASLVLWLASGVVFWAAEQAFLNREASKISWALPPDPNEPAPGWERDVFFKTNISSQESFTFFPSRGSYLKYFTPDHGVVFILLLEDVPACETTSDYACTEQPEGTLLFAPYDAYDERRVLVSPSSPWAVSFEGDESLPRKVLSSLESASLSEFEDTLDTQVSR